MKKSFLIMTVAGTGLCISCGQQQPVAPEVKKVPHEMTIHGDTRVDNYYWLNERENPEVIHYLEKENAYLKAMMKHTEPLQEQLYKEIRGRVKEQDESVPYFHNDYYYYTRTLPNTEYALLCRKKGDLSAGEEVYLDVNKMAEGYAYYGLGGASFSPDNKIVAYGVDTVSRLQYTIYFKNVETGEQYADFIPNTEGHCVWANDNKTVFYTMNNTQTLRSEKIMKHVLGTPASDDVEVYYEKDETFDIGVGKTKSNAYIVIGAYATLTSEIRVLDADKPDGEFRVLQPREKELEYYIEHLDNDFYVYTNWNAKNYRIMKTPVNKGAKEHWTEVVPGRDNVQLKDFTLFKDYLVLGEKEDGQGRLCVMRIADKKMTTVPMDETVFSAGISTNRELHTDWVRYGYSSMLTPYTTYEYNMATGERKVLKRTEVPTYNREQYETFRVYATARDGKKIPVSIVQKKGLPKDGSNPLLLYGYGSYGVTIEPTFNGTRVSLLDRGFVYAIAHIRGGQIYGRDWYEEGRLLNKKNTFTDFIDCAEYLVKEKYAGENKVFAMGGSAGGLLMGAVVNMRPDLFKGVVADVPFVDVVTTMLDETIPLTTGEYSEWGNPNEKAYYDYIKSYSPYDNVEMKAYPAMLVTTGLHDSQVQYFEPAKWVAKLRELKTDKNPLLFSINMDFGHGGASGRFEYIKEIALEYAFMLDLLGIKE